MSVNRGSSILIQTFFFFSRMLSVEISTEPTVYRCWKTIIAEKQSRNYVKSTPRIFYMTFFIHTASKKKKTWNLESRTVCCPVSGHLKRKLNFWGALFRYRWTKYFERKLNISALRWRFCRVESLQNSRKRPCSVQVNKHFMANIYTVYCAVKLVLLGKG